MAEGGIVGGLLQCTLVRTKIGCLFKGVCLCALKGGTDCTPISIVYSVVLRLYSRRVLSRSCPP